MAGLKEAEPFLIKLLKKNYNTYDAAREVKKIARFEDLKENSLRHRAWDLQKNLGVGSRKVITKTEHKKIMNEWKRKLQRRGFDVIDKQREIQKCMKALGVDRSNPDLFALKPALHEKLREWMKESFIVHGMIPFGRKNQIILVEVVDRAKTMHGLAEQILRYKEVGKVVIVFPFNVLGITFAGYAIKN